MEKGTIHYTAPQADLYRAAADVVKKLGLPVWADPEDHLTIPQPPEWLFEAQSPEAMTAFAATKARLCHNSANTLVYDIDKGDVYFEFHVCPDTEDFPGDDWFAPVKVAKSVADFVRLIRENQSFK